MEPENVPFMSICILYADSKYMYYSLNGEYETALYRLWFVIYRPRWPFKAGDITFWQIILGENESWPILDDLFFSSF